MNVRFRLVVATLAATMVLPAAGYGQDTPPTPPAPPADAAPPAPAPPPAAEPSPPAALPPAATAPPAAEPPAPVDPKAQNLPEVEIIQKEAAPGESSAPAVKKKKVVKKQDPAPAPKPKPAVKAKPAPEPEPAPVEPETVEAPPPQPEQPVNPNPVFGAQASTGAAARAAQAAQSPINPTSIVPQDLQGYSNSATNLTPEILKENQPRNINEALTRVPGIVVINDDGAGSHGGIAARGSPARRSRKILVMEDGHAVNLALWLDPSVHFFAPAERLEGIEVIRGTTVTHGPNNNFGVVNVRNLSPFGVDETVVSSAIGFTKNKTGVFEEFDADDAVGPRFGTSDTDFSAKWHAHTRQTSGNVGAVASYTGENVQGTWDTERLRFHDFYGALGWKGVDQDLVVSASYARQRDNYSELNLTGEEDEDPPGAVEERFFKLGHCQTCYAPNAGLNNYNGEIWRGQIVHNYFIDDDTTVTTRLYAGQHRRDRYQLISAEADPDGNVGLAPVIDEADGEILFAEDTMFGRLRTFRHVGAEVRGEWANRPLVAGLSQTIQAGIRYEYQDMTNRNFLGAEGEVLSNGDEAGVTIFDRSLDVNAVSAFLQSSIKVASDVNVVPGVRLEWYKASRRNRVIAGEESEAEEVVPGEGGTPADACDDLAPGLDECLEIEGIVFDPARPTENFSNFNALPGVSFAYTGFNKTTVFGGYHRGMSTAVLRNEDFPAPDELGDNFELGVRSTAFMGLAFEVAAFHQRLQDYQFGSSFSDGADRSFGRADEVHINGVEMLARLNSQPFTGGPYNLYGEANYTYARGIFKKGSKIVVDEDTGDEEVVSFAGNRIPETPLHVAALTVGLQNDTGWKWDASVTWTYRGAFFTDEDNTPFGGDPEGENGEVPEVWLLSARFNLDIGQTGASVFVSGDNLLDEFYITDREDGLKPGLGRTFWTGFKYKF